MIMYKYYFIMLLIISISNASYQAIQTDWSGGPFFPEGIQVENTWDSTFAGWEEGVDWASSPGIISLEPYCMEWDEKVIVDSTFSYIKAVCSADIDGDGDIDVLGTNGYYHNIAWCENKDGIGLTWIKHIIDANYYGPQDIISRDFDGDADMDVIAVSTYGQVVWWENSGNGSTWTKHLIGEHSNARSAAVFDIDNDSDLDVVSTGTYGGTNQLTKWWENENGIGTQWLGRNIIDIGTYDPILCFDIDNDGDGDIFLEDLFLRNIDGSGTSWETTTMGGRVQDYSDIDADGDIDLVCFATEYDVIWLENCDGYGYQWEEKQLSGSGIWDDWLVACVTDRNLDERPDVVAIDEYMGTIWWFENHGSFEEDHRWSVDVIGPCPAYPSYNIDLSTADLNNDNITDIITSWDSIHSIIAYFGQINEVYSGTLKSRILDTNMYSHQWASLEWTSVTPDESQVYFQYRTSDSPGMYGGWSEPLYGPTNLSGILKRYFQYKVTLQTDSLQYVPYVEDVSLNWDPVGIENNPTISEFSLYGATPNPARVTISINFAVPKLSSVGFFIYDLTGHLVSTHSQEEYSSGIHQIQFDALAPGIYFCQMVSEEFTATQQFVVIE